MHLLSDLLEAGKIYLYICVYTKQVKKTTLEDGVTIDPQSWEPVCLMLFLLN